MRAGRALAGVLQHNQAAFLAGIQTTRAESVAWKSGKHKTLSTFPCLRLRRLLSELRDDCIKLTLRWHKILGRPTPLADEIVDSGDNNYIRIGALFAGNLASDVS